MSPDEAYIVSGQLQGSKPQRHLMRLTFVWAVTGE